MSLHDLEQSREALARMLDDFSKSNRGSAMMKVPSLQEQQRIIAEALFKRSAEGLLSLRLNRFIHELYINNVRELSSNIFKLFFAIFYLIN